MRTWIAACAAVLAGASASAQEGGDTPEMRAALAAGYKAAFVCSATFNADRTFPLIAANELDLIYPDYREAVARLPGAEINNEASTVSVTYSADMPPRIAVWRPGLGCAQLPIGAEPVLADYVPGFTSWPQPALPDTNPIIGDDAPLTPDLDAMGRLEAPIDFAFDGRTFGEGTRTSAVVVVKNGRVAAEQYARGITAETPQRTWSVAKSLSATIIGAAMHQGLIHVDEEARLEAWSAPFDPRQKIKVQDLLHMASGLDSGERGSRTDRIYFGGASVADHAATKQLEAAPGSRFKYANNDTLLAMRALAERFDDKGAYRRFPYESLFLKIGAERTTLETDWRGDFLSSSQVWTTARDLARIGQLYLQDGVWRGERILPFGWWEWVSAPLGPQPTQGDYGYGAQFWLIGGIDGLPAETFAALGHRGQHLVIVPSKDVVIVRRGYDESGGAPFDITAFAATVLKALEPPPPPLEPLEEGEEAR
ncbi:MAG: serine hydrolase [Pseudomonadota bacterium]